MSWPRACREKTHTELAAEWDQLAPERYRQLVSGEDISFDHVVVPTALQLLDGLDRATVLEVGSGTGVFTSKLAQRSERVIAVDPSQTNMEIARCACVHSDNIQFIEGTLEKVSEYRYIEQATAGVAVMTLMTVPNLRGFVQALATVLRPNAYFVAILTHPWFWAKYWGYEQEAWFRYDREIFIEAPFAISKCQTQVLTTHIHRPIGHYVKAFVDQGFRLDAWEEPLPTPEVEALYASEWAFPRFLAMRWQKYSETD